MYNQMLQTTRPAGYLVNEIISLYKGCKTTVLVEGELLDSFSVKVGVDEVQSYLSL